MTGRRIAAAIVVGALSAGCSIDPEQGARLVDDDEVPFGLLDQPEAPPSTVGGDAAQQRTVYLVNEDDLLVAVLRTVRQADAASIVATLDDDLDEAEVGLGLRTLLDDDGEAPLVLDLAVDRGIATADLASAFLELDGETQVLALAQVVLTLTSQPGIGQVAITTDGAPAEVPRADGTTTSDPVAAADYSELVAP